MRQKKQKEILEIVNNNYQVIAKHFSQTREQRMWPEIIDIAKRIPANSKILDGGCGNGRLANELKEGVDYLGVDNSNNLISIAKNKNKDNENNKFQVLDIFELDKLADKYDYIFLVAVLQHIPSKELRNKALNKIKDTLKEDGEIIISVWNLVDNKKYKKQLQKSKYLNFFKGLDPRDLLFYWKNSQGEKLSLRYYHAFTTKELKKLFIKCGLKVKSFQKTKDNFYIVLRK
ncbi:MAG TPA: class I SAM-dependent methyltransferase [Patescibacteria group bacterium]|nr:class I SAM-dependent methyltransferase [Patescibacteria group bacterium]